MGFRPFVSLWIINNHMQDCRSIARVFIGMNRIGSKPDAFSLTNNKRLTVPYISTWSLEYGYKFRRPF